MMVTENDTASNRELLIEDFRYADYVNVQEQTKMK